MTNTINLETLIGEIELELGDPPIATKLAICFEPSSSDADILHAVQKAIDDLPDMGDAVTKANSIIVLSSAGLSETTIDYLFANIRSPCTFNVTADYLM